MTDEYKKIGRVVFKAQLGDGPVQVVGENDLYDVDIEECESIEDFLMNEGSDWAFNAVHSDCLSYWAEFVEEKDD